MWTKDETIQVTGTISEVLPDVRFRVELPNGHLVRAHLSAKLRKELADLRVGDRVQVELSTYDLSKARILLRQP